MIGLLLLAALLCLTTAPISAQEEGPLVLAFYYAWYDQNTWTSGTVADQPQAPYVSADAAVMERHIDQAMAAGIDAFVVSWYGPQEANNQTEANLRQLLDIAAAKGFKIAVDFETKGPFFPDRDSVSEALRYLLANHAQHPAYLKYAGKPVIFFWRQQRFSVSQWQEIRSSVDPNRTSLWIAEGTDIDYQSVFDGHHLYSIAWSPDVDHTLDDWSFRVRQYEHQQGVDRLWVATVMPGYDDTGTTRSDAFAVDRRQGAYYQESWAAARDSHPDWVIITSFNEWVEGTMIEPSATYGNLYLDLTREQVALFKADQPVSDAQDDESQPETKATTEAQSTSEEPAQDGPSIRADETVRIRSGPGTQYERLGRLAKGKSLPVTGKSEDDLWWQVEVATAVSPDGTGWVTADFVTFSGDADEVPIVEAPQPPPESSPATTTTVTVTATAAPTQTRAQSNKPSPTATRATRKVTGTPAPSPTWAGNILATLTPSPTSPESEANDNAANPAVSTVEPQRNLILEQELTSSPVPSTTAVPATGTAVAPTATSTLRLETVAKRQGPPTLLWAGAITVLAAGGLSFVAVRRTRLGRHQASRRRH